MDVYTIHVIKSPITEEKLRTIASEGYGDVVKAVIDVKQEIMALGGQMHADEEVELMVKHGSQRAHTWGINLELENPRKAWIRFDSMINLKPFLNNRTRGVDNPEIQKKIKDIVEQLVLS